MQKLFKLTILLSILFVSCYEETQVEIVPDFEVLSVNENFTVPAEFSLVNKSTGADRYLWAFEGGSPATSTLKAPGNVVFREPGVHLIRLECWHGNVSKTKEFELKLDPVIFHSFKSEIQVNAYAPVYVKFTNETKGANSFEWTFEGGTPTSSQLQDPPPVCFEQPGIYVIQLISGNGRKEYKSTDTITVLPRLQTEFILSPSFQDEDFEAPAVFYSENKSISNLRSHWSVSNGGTVKNDTATHAEFYLETPGSYTITLQTDNDKEKQTLSKEIKILPNNNLYTVKDVRFGVSSAKENGAFFSSHFRKVFQENEIDETNGKQIDFVFFMLNEYFNFCRVLSPDQADEFVYSPIPEAIKTFVINDLQPKNISFSTQDFESMTNDDLLKPLEIRKNDTGDAYFKPESLPFVILFETIDGRKGAILIKEIRKLGKESYAIADVKVQKSKN